MSPFLRGLLATDAHNYAQSTPRVLAPEMLSNVRAAMPSPSHSRGRKDRATENGASGLLAANRAAELKECIQQASATDVPLIPRGVAPQIPSLGEPHSDTRRGLMQPYDLNAAAVSLMQQATHGHCAARFSLPGAAYPGVDPAHVLNQSHPNHASAMALLGSIMKLAQPQARQQPQQPQAAQHPPAGGLTRRFLELGAPITHQHSLANTSHRLPMQPSGAPNFTGTSFAAGGGLGRAASLAQVYVHVVCGKRRIIVTSNNR